MILSHEIPQGCKLYFGKNAKAKRELENLASTILYQKGYEEIVTPTFSFWNIKGIHIVVKLCGPTTNTIIKSPFAMILQLI